MLKEYYPEKSTMLKVWGRGLRISKNKISNELFYFYYLPNKSDRRDVLVLRFMCALRDSNICNGRIYSSVEIISTNNLISCSYGYSDLLISPLPSGYFLTLAGFASSCHVTDGLTYSFLPPSRLPYPCLRDNEVVALLT